MAKFFKLSSDTIINIDSIQMITKIIGEHCFEKDDHCYGKECGVNMKFTPTGRNIFSNAKYYGINMADFNVSKREVEKYGIVYDIGNITEEMKKRIVAYHVHLNVPCGGINYSHERVTITVSDYNRLIKFMDIVS